MTAPSLRPPALAFALVAAAISVSGSAVLSAQVPRLINYQGRVAVGTTNFDGTGSFKFALVNAAGTTAYWTNDGTHLDGSEPTNAVSLPVTKGLYAVLLGDTALANMTAIPDTIFTHPDVRLRVWFNDGTNGSQLLTPDQRIAAVGYSMMAAALEPGANIVAGTITADAFVSTAAGVEPASGVTPILAMIWVKPGTFVMGSPSSEANRDPDEGPQTVVTLTQGFWIGHHEVTQGEFLKVMGTNPSTFTGNLNRPVEMVSWTTAVAFCAALTASEQTAGRIPAGWAYRLPTEAEWEYSCRAYTTTRYSYGDDPGATALTNYAWIDVNGSAMTHPVGQKLPNPWGLVDMHGNCFEWCQDWFLPNHPGGVVTDWVQTTPTSDRVIHGGSWLDGTPMCRSANRYGYPPNTAYSDVSFRVVLARVLP